MKRFIPCALALAFGAAALPSGRGPRRIPLSPALLAIRPAPRSAAPMPAATRPSWSPWPS